MPHLDLLLQLKKNFLFEKLSFFFCSPFPHSTWHLWQVNPSTWEHVEPYPDLHQAWFACKPKLILGISSTDQVAFDFPVEYEVMAGN